MEPTYFTDKEANEAGIKKPLLDDWCDIMQALWTASIVLYKGMNNERLKPVNGENEILLGSEFVIKTSICNDSFLQVEFRSSDYKRSYCEFRYFGDVNTICKSLAIYLRDFIQAGS